MRITFDYLRKLFLLKVKYASASIIATAIEYGAYFLIRNTALSKELAQVISYTLGMLTNFFLQKSYVFTLKRSVGKTFLLAVLISLGGLGLNILIFTSLLRFPFFESYDYLAKMIATGTVFFYNFYLKRFAFEKRFFKID